MKNELGQSRIKSQFLLSVRNEQRKLKLFKLIKRSKILTHEVFDERYVSSVLEQTQAYLTKLESILSAISFDEHLDYYARNILVNEKNQKRQKSILTHQSKEQLRNMIDYLAKINQLEEEVDWLHYLNRYSYIVHPSIDNNHKKR